MNDAEREQLGRALGLVPSGLFVMTACDGEASSAFLASWVMQAAFDPPGLTAAVRKGRPVLEPLERDGRFAINVLPADDRRLMKHFARGFPPGEPWQEGLKIEKAPSGAEILPDGLAWLDCRRTGTLDAGDHVVVLGEITAGGVFGEGGQPATWVRRSGFSY